MSDAAGHLRIAQNARARRRQETPRGFSISWRCLWNRGLDDRAREATVEAELAKLAGRA